MIKRSAAFLLGLLIMFCAQLLAAEQEIVTVSPSWQGFTSSKGQGLYHDLMRAVFTPEGYRLRHIEAPAKRGRLMLRENENSVYMCMPSDDTGLELATMPMYEGKFHAFFLTATFPYWKGMASLEGRSVVSRLGYYSSRDFNVPVHISETRSGEEAMVRVLRGEADAYVDDRHLIEETLAASPPVDARETRIEHIGFRAYYPVFSPSEQGRKLRDLFDTGMKRLATTGRLDAIYARWHLPMPRCYKN